MSSSSEIINPVHEQTTSSSVPFSKIFDLKKHPTYFRGGLKLWIFLADDPLVDFKVQFDV
jgi:hypothetical protein